VYSYQTAYHIDTVLSVYSYWDTLDAICGAPPAEYTPALNHALPVIKMAEEPWTCRRIPILSYYGQQPGPAFKCGNCDVCFADNLGLPYTIDITQHIERLQKLCFERPGGQTKAIGRTEIRRKMGDHRNGLRVVEYLVFKGILREVPWQHDRVLRCRLEMVGSFWKSRLFTNKPNYRFPDLWFPPPCLLSALHGFPDFEGYQNLNRRLNGFQSTPV
jgi:hypothetical protein